MTGKSTFLHCKTFIYTYIYGGSCNIILIKELQPTSDKDLVLLLVLV